MDGDAAAAPDDTAALVLAARAGDSAAFARLYARYAPLVHGVILARVAAAEARDLVQDVFVRALEKLPALREPAAFGPWVASIARNTAADRHRRGDRAELGQAPDQVPDETAPAQTTQTEALAALALINQLPLAYREPLILRLVEGMSGPEIAARTGLTPASVRVNLCRGMKLLRARLTARGQGRGREDDGHE